MLLPARMKKVVVVGLTADRDRVLSVLHDLRVIQMERAGKEVLSYFSAEKGGAAEKEITDELQRFRTLVSALPPVHVTSEAHFPSTEALLEAAHSITIDGEVHSLKRREDELLTLIHNLEETRGVLEEFSFFNEDLSLLVARSVFSFFTTVPSDKFDGFRKGVTSLSKDAYMSTPVHSADRKSVRLVVVVPREHAEEFAKITQHHVARLYAVPSEFPGKPSEAKFEIDSRLSSASKELDDTRAKLRSISEKWYAKVLPIEESLVIEGRKAEAVGLLGRSSSSFALEGWVPEKSLPSVEKEVKRVTGGKCQIITLENAEGAPTMLENPKGIGIYEFFIRFYSLPQSSEMDPTLIFAIVFPIFFGFMLADVGYAAFILAVCLWLTWRIGNKTAGPTHVPKFLVNFTTTVVPPGAMKQLAKGLIPGCLIGIALGVTFDSYFGFTLAQWSFGHFDFAIIAPVNGRPGQMVYVAKLLLLSTYIGLSMVTLGLLFGAINNYMHRNWLHLTGKVCWILVAWGVMLIGLSLVTHYPGSWLIASHQFFYEYVAIALVGVVGVLATEGALAAVELPSIVSHVLSYARLVGILLASVILAYVINSIAIVGLPGTSALITHGVGYAVLAVILVLIVAVFNIILGVVEPGIQGARLMYVEYFSKFYKGNGRAFVPFGSRRRYTRPQLLEAHPELKSAT